jgi:hypothetical protein
VPRQPAAVEEAEFEGFFLFGFRPSSRSAKTTEVERPAATNWNSKPGLKKKPAKAATAKDGGKKKQKIASKKKIVKQEEQAAAAEAPATKKVEPAAEPCTPDIIGDLSEDCKQPEGTAANRD